MKRTRVFIAGALALVLLCGGVAAAGAVGFGLGMRRGQGFISAPGYGAYRPPAPPSLDQQPGEPSQPPSPRQVGPRGGAQPMPGFGNFPNYGPQFGRGFGPMGGFGFGILGFFGGIVRFVIGLALLALLARLLLGAFGGRHRGCGMGWRRGPFGGPGGPGGTDGHGAPPFFAEWHRQQHAAEGAVKSDSPAAVDPGMPAATEPQAPKPPTTPPAPIE